MPVDPRRRDNIVAAVAAHDSANPSAPLPRNAARLLAAMFPSRRCANGASRPSLRRGSPAKPPRFAETPRRSWVLVQAAGIGCRAGYLPAAAATGAAMRYHRREKVFGPGRAVPLDRNAKARIAAYARAWSARNRQPRQHRGPITRAFLDVLKALLWGFHNSRSGVCFPSYEAIAAKAECARSTVAEAIKALEWAGVLTWQHRITRILVRERDLFGQWAGRWRVIRTSNAYVFRDPKPGLPCGFSCKSENLTGTLDQEVLSLELAPAPDPNSPLERALARFGAALGVKDGIEQGSGPVGAT